MANIIKATTTSKARVNLTQILKEVSQENTEYHIVLNSGKNAVIISEDELNKYRQNAKYDKLIEEAQESGMSGKFYDNATQMVKDILGASYEI